MDLSDPVMLARLQFAANVTFHILFPAITIALAWVLLYFKLRFSAERNDMWKQAYQFWVKIFALTFAFGVVSGITMSFQFGTNWPGFMNKFGNIAGPLLGYEVLTAFFLEATFLGVMLFGMNRVSDKIHTLATALVAIGTSLSAFWIMALNSWMQTPAGFEMVNGEAVVTSWLEIIFNPSFEHRFFHMFLASGLTAAFLIAGVSAFQYLRGNRGEGVKAALKTGIVIAATLIPVQIVGGDLLGLNSYKHQPEKVAAIEGVWETEKGAPLLLFAMPNDETKSNDYEIGIPKLASLILTHDSEGEIRGIEEFGDKYPPVGTVFWSFRVMVGVGLLMLAVSWLYCASLLKNRGQINDNCAFTRYLHYALVGMAFSGWVATVAGWWVTEIGRQPYIVYGVTETAEVASDVAAPLIGMSLTAYIVLYIALLFFYVTTVFYLAKRQGQSVEADKNAPPTNPGEALSNLIGQGA